MAALKRKQDKKAPEEGIRPAKFKLTLSGGRVTSNAAAAMHLYDKSIFGEKTEGKIAYSLAEAFFLIRKEKADIYSKGKKLPSEKFADEANGLEPGFLTKYRVFADLRDKGYVVKTGLKFGADFRVYDKGIKPGKSHSKWVVFPVDSGSGLTWYEFAAKNRVAHSTKKNLLIAIVDDEGDVTYYECRWLRP